MRVIFMGTPEFSVPVLEALVAAGHEIAGHAMSLLHTGLQTTRAAVEGGVPGRLRAFSAGASPPPRRRAASMEKHSKSNSNDESFREPPQSLHDVADRGPNN